MRQHESKTASPYCSKAQLLLCQSWRATCSEAQALQPQQGTIADDAIRNTKRFRCMSASADTCQQKLRLPRSREEYIHQGQIHEPWQKGTAAEKQKHQRRGAELPFVAVGPAATRAQPLARAAPGAEVLASVTAGCAARAAAAASSSSLITSCRLPPTARATMTASVTVSITLQGVR